MSEEPICGTGCGRFRWKENGRSPMVFVLGGGAMRPVPSLFDGAAAAPPGSVGVFELTCWEFLLDDPVVLSSFANLC